MIPICRIHQLDMTTGPYYPWTAEDCPYCLIGRLRAEINRRDAFCCKCEDDNNSQLAAVNEQLARYAGAIEVVRGIDGTP